MKAILGIVEKKNYRFSVDSQRLTKRLDLRKRINKTRSSKILEEIKNHSDQGISARSLKTTLGIPYSTTLAICNHLWIKGRICKIPSSNHNLKREFRFFPNDAIYKVCQSVEVT